MKAVMKAGVSAVSLVWAASALASDIVPPKAYTMTPGGVSLADGSFTFTDVDLSIGDLKLERIHLGGEKDPNTTFFGPRMTHNFDIFVAPNHRTDCSGGPATCTTYNKPVVHFGLTASGKYYESQPPNSVLLEDDDDAMKGELTHGAGYVSDPYVYTDQDGATYTFSASVAAAGVSYGQRVVNIAFPDGHQQNFLYDGSARLKAVTSTNGYGIVFDYNGSGSVSAACGYDLAAVTVSASSSCAGAALKVSYGYDGGSPAKLISVTDVSGNTTGYSYYGQEIACITPPGYSSCKVSNTYGYPSAPWMVTQQTMSDGAVWHFDFGGTYSGARDPEMYAEVEPTGTAIVTDPASKTSSYAFVASAPYSAVDANGNGTSYRYTGSWDYMSSTAGAQDFGSMLLEVDLPEGNKYLAQYGGPRHAVTQETVVSKPGSSLSNASIQYGYVADCTSAGTPQNCAKPIWRKDANGNQTDMGYTSWGGITYEMGPAARAGAARPLKLFSYIQKYASIQNGSSMLVAANAPVWKLSSETECQTAVGSSMPACDSSAPQKLTSYEYGADGTADNLLVRGVVVTADGTSRRTCYGYDQYSNKISETRPRAGLTSCP